MVSFSLIQVTKGKMAMIINMISLFVAMLFSCFANAANAELQTWQLTATVYKVSDGFSPPFFASIGQTINFDYLIETSTNLTNNFHFMGAVKSVSFDGQDSQVSGYILAMNGLDAINASLANRSDGVNFISFNYFGGSYETSVTDALNGFSAATPSSSVDLRLDFGYNYIWAHPIYFASIPAVPEPPSIILLISGLLLVFLVKLKQLGNQLAYYFFGQARPS